MIIATDTVLMRARIFICTLPHSFSCSMISLTRCSALVILASAVYSILVTADGLTRSDGQANLNQFTAANCAQGSVYPPMNGDSGFLLSAKRNPDECQQLKSNDTERVDMIGMYWGNTTDKSNHYVARQLTFYTDDNCKTVGQWFVNAGSGDGKIGEETPCFNQSDWGGPYGSFMMHRSADADAVGKTTVGPGKSTD